MRNTWNEAQLEELQLRLISGLTVAEVAQMYGVTTSTLYIVLRRYGIKTPRYSRCGEHLTASEKFLSLRLSSVGQRIEDYLPIPRNCAVSGFRLRYSRGCKNTARLILHKGEWLVVSYTIGELMLKYSETEIKKLAGFYNDTGL